MRALIRLFLIGLATLTLYPIFLVGDATLRRAPNARRRWRNRLVRRWSSTLAKILGVRLQIEGTRPDGAFLLVANHLGYLDILILGSVTDVAFIAKSEMASWPVIGRLARTTGTIFIDRESKRDTVRVSSQIEAALRDGYAVALFPEGTSSDGSSVLPFKSSLLEVAARANLAVHHATLQYAVHAAWFGDDPLVPHFWRVLQLPHVDATVRFGGAIASDDRKELARRLREEIAGNLTPTRAST